HTFLSQRCAVIVPHLMLRTRMLFSIIIFLHKEENLLVEQNDFNSIYSSETIAKALYGIYHYSFDLFDT
ncbi:MAG: hypothetical protein CMK36_04420, partial [Porticoccaceae bacterium]|nr:hypothetical protein [Porticoccaceae bacterium]